MGRKDYDAIIVGARCAGSPLAMLLARKGHKVLLVDRAKFPSDTLSTHMLHPPGVAALRRWGLLDRLVATGVPPVDVYSFDFGEFVLSGSPGTAEAPFSYAPRRTVLDKILLDAAAEAGVDVREGFSVDEVLFEDGRATGILGRGRGGSVNERARVVVGADGRNSLVARFVEAERYHEKPPLLAAYYSYWSGLPMNGTFQTYTLPHRGFAMWPTHDDLTLVIGGWPFAEFEDNKHDIEGHMRKIFEMVPDVAARMDGATRETRFAGTAVPGYFRKPYGDGWALVGDAGYNKDFITAQGMQDAFRDAELCAGALDAAWSGARGYDEAMAGYQAERDARSLAMYEFTSNLATLEPPPPEVAQVLGAAQGNQEAMDAFVRMVAGVISPAEFFAPEHIGRIMASAQGNRASAG